MNLNSFYGEIVQGGVWYPSHTVCFAQIALDCFAGESNRFRIFIMPTTPEIFYKSKSISLSRPANREATVKRPFDRFTAFSNTVKRSIEAVPEQELNKDSNLLRRSIVWIWIRSPSLEPCCAPAPTFLSLILIWNSPLHCENNIKSQKFQPKQKKGFS